MIDSKDLDGRVRSAADPNMFEQAQIREDRRTFRNYVVGGVAAITGAALLTYSVFIMPFKQVSFDEVLQGWNRSKNDGNYSLVFDPRCEQNRGFGGDPRYRITVGEIVDSNKSPLDAGTTYHVDAYKTLAGMLSNGWRAKSITPSKR